MSYKSELNARFTSDYIVNVSVWDVGLSELISGRVSTLTSLSTSEIRLSEMIC